MSRSLLSGWAWLWIGLTLAVWAYGAWWTLTNIGMPPMTATANEACLYTGFGTPAGDAVDQARECLADPAIEARARERYLADMRFEYAVVVGFWLLLPIVPGLVIWGFAWARKALIK
jgi:hypothetical protein